MNTGTADVVTYVTGFTVGVFLIADGLLRARGIDWSQRRRRSGTAFPVRISLMAGAGMCLITASRIPSGHRLLWDALLMTPGTLLLVWSMVLLVRSARSRGEA